MNLNKETKIEYFSKYESNDGKPFWGNCKLHFTNKHSNADTDIMLSENGHGELILILNPLLTTLAWIAGMIIPCHQRWVLIDLISLNGIKTTPA